MNPYWLVLWVSVVGATVLFVHRYGHHDEPTKLPPPERPIDFTHAAPNNHRRAP